MTVTAEEQERVIEALKSIREIGFNKFGNRETRKWRVHRIDDQAFFVVDKQRWERRYFVTYEKSFWTRKVTWRVERLGRYESPRRRG